MTLGMLATGVFLGMRGRIQVENNNLKSFKVQQFYRIFLLLCKLAQYQDLKSSDHTKTLCRAQQPGLREMPMRQAQWHRGEVSGSQAILRELIRE